MIKTLSADDILHIHATLAKEFGGNAALRDKGALEKALEGGISGGEKGLFEKAAGLMAGLAVQAPFVERNVRTAFFAADVFLRMNGFYLRCDNVVTFRFFSALLEEGNFTGDTLLPWIESSVEKVNP